MVNKTKDKLNQVGMAIYQKPMDNNCYEKRSENNLPLCKESDAADAAWYFGSLRRICFQYNKVFLCFAYTAFWLQECTFGSMHAQIACWPNTSRSKMARVVATKA